MCFLPLKSSHNPSRPVPVPELFGKYPTRPVPKSKTPTHQTLVVGWGPDGYLRPVQFLDHLTVIKICLTQKFT